MGIARTQDDAYVKEMQKFEHRDVFLNGTFIQAVPMSEGGKKDAPLSEYPKMLYRAESFDGGPRISGTKIVSDESAERLACGQGWALTQEQAIARVHENQLEMARLAANRVHNEQWMSEAAKKEAAAVDESTMQHLPSIPETPILKRQPKESK